MNFVIGQITPVMLDNITYGTYFFFFATNVCCNLIVYLFYPESKNRTLEEIKILFGGEEADQIAKMAERKYGSNVTEEAAQEKMEDAPTNSSKEIPESSTKEAAP